MVNVIKFTECPDEFLRVKVKVNSPQIFQFFFAGYAYYGEYPLAFASCFGREEIYDYLIDNGADPDAKDSFGNAVLHMLVISNQLVSLYS